MAERKDNRLTEKGKQGRIERRSAKELKRDLPKEKCKICGGNHTVHNVKGGD